ncbi:TIR domain-containing protein [Weissella paramesenteroides]|uniref:TIR domain-containing protein n=1 Tax=Weissella paramesenteroides TaxID=1249 RepID=UPI00123C6A05|nr:TIR domain-containing protein [Weissella paramesenteroides]KAA8455310.1 molecular chaperone Tir [Weissella paramesenteroides]KAA8456226.1 molecular chaperone Tir [Weissella paramesenteroides]KAA8457771.1 molecular chaperone Tir [Weissella paramesenteroides]KAA8461751.1 molecular chaperone Tir [Weissella paramesenteroides]KAA8462536.1 molecular chaperone Tir [Weissella paramesenteroides]
MAHKVFISYKTEDTEYKDIIQDELDIDMIDNSLNSPVKSENEDYILRYIRENHLSKSTVTLTLIGNRSAESLHPLFEDQYYIKREMQASLYNGTGNSKNGVLAVILPSMYNAVYPSPNTTTSSFDGNTVSISNISDDTVIKEISENFYLDSPMHDVNRDYWTSNERYVIAVKWDDFISNPNKYIDMAYAKRTAPIANYTKVHPK